jgi:hypothetical protein
MVGSRSKSHSVRALTIVLLLASSLLALAKPEDVLTADITQGKVGKLSQNGVVPHKNMGGVMHGWRAEEIARCDCIRCFFVHEES